MVTERADRSGQNELDPRTAVERQLSRLFGESLLGAWPEVEQKLPRLPLRVPKRRWPMVAGALLVMLVAVLAVTLRQRPELDRTSLERRAHYAEELRTFLQDGELDRASEFVALLRGERMRLDPADPHLDRMLRAEAAIYRYSDADPARLARIRPFLVTSPGGASPERLLASLTVLSRGERAERWTWLVGLRTPLGLDPELYHLLATAAEARGELEAAREAWLRSAELGPRWLSHRFEQAEFERRRNNATVAQKIAGQMLRADPDSTWSRLAASEFEVRMAPVASADDSRRPPTPPPVQVYRGELLGVLHAARGGDQAAARRHLAAAVAAVHGEAPFMLDAFDWLLGAELPGFAEELTRLPAWPRDSEAARRKTARSFAQRTVPSSEVRP